LKTTFLSIDFGASRVKWTLNSINDIKLLDCGNFSNPYLKSNEYVEISISELIKLTKKLISSLLLKWNIEKILISSQMHGFAVMDSSNFFLTEYISWFDQRFRNYEKEILERFINNHSDTFYNNTGMTIKSSLPYFNSISVLKKLNNKSIKLVSLPEILLYGLGVKTPKVHTTIIAGTGFFNIKENCNSVDLLNIHHKLTKKNIFFNENTDLYTSFETKISGKIINISIGYGDHQCAVLGANNSLSTTSINMGTGSQVSKIITKKEIELSGSNLIQFRPYFNNNFLKCITHIPSGRVLNNYLNILDSNTSIKTIWDEVHKLNIKDIFNSTLNFNLSIFPDAFNYKKINGVIDGITENNFIYTNYLASLIKSYLNQYDEIIDMVEKNSKIKSTQIILSGGLSKQIKISKKFFEITKSRKVIQCKTNYIEDEAILGLKKIMKYEN
jgi:sugar (pentulose or hexulose) kinase